MDLHLLLSTRWSDVPFSVGAAQNGLGSQEGIHHGCAILALISISAILCHYRRRSTGKAGHNEVPELPWLRIGVFKQLTKY